MKRWQIVTLLIVALFIAAVLGGAVWYFWGPCGKQATADAWAKIRPNLSTWFDAYYDESIYNLTKHWQISNGISVPACMTDDMRQMNQAMEDTVNSFWGYVKEEPKAIVAYAMKPDAVKFHGQRLEAIVACAPFCR